MTTTSNELIETWNQRYKTAIDWPEPATVLIENQHLLPDQGQALDIACGLGNNALLLADHGLQTTAWDVSEVAINKLNDFCHSAGLTINAAVRDVERHPPPADSFAIITVSRFLVRDLAPALVAALRPGGLLFYQTFTKIKAYPGGPDKDEFLLADNELLQLFGDLRPRVYREEAGLGDINKGFRNSAMLVAEKP